MRPANLWRTGAMLAFVLLAGCQTFTERLASEEAPAPVTPQELNDGKLDDKHTAELCLATANKLSQDGFSVKAIGLYQKARHLNPQLKVSHGLAKNYAKLDMPEKAEEEFKIALHETPNDADLLNDVGCFYLRTNRLPEASDMLRKAVAANPHHPRATMNLAECCVRNDQIQEGIDLYSAQVGQAAALSNTGILLASMGRTQEAEDLLQQALARDPNLEAAKAFLNNLDHNDDSVAATPIAAKPAARK